MHGLLRRLFAPRWQHPDPEVRRKAINQLDPQQPEQRDALTALAKDSDSDIQLTALLALDDIAGLLDGYTQHTGNEAWLDAACQRLTGAEGHTDLHQRQALVAELADPRLLNTIAQQGDNLDLRLAALEQLSDEKDLIFHACHNGVAAVRHRAAQRIEDEESLKRLLKEARRDRQVMRLAREKLTQLRNDAEWLQEQQSQREHLLSQLEQHAKAPWEPLYGGRFRHLEREWKNLDHSPSTEQEQRFQQALLGCRKRLHDHKTQEQIRQQNLVSLAEVESSRETLLEGWEETLNGLTNASGLTVQDIDSLRGQHQLLEQRWLALSDQHPPSELMQRRYAQALASHERYLLAWQRWQVSEIPLENALSQQDYPTTVALIQQCAWPTTLAPPALLKRARREVSANNTQAKRPSSSLSLINAELDNFEQLLERGEFKSASRLHQRLKPSLESLTTHDAKPYKARLKHLGAQLAELRDWRGFVAGPKREQLCASIETLADDQHMAEMALDRHHRQLVKEWKALGDAAANRDLSTRFRAASDRIHTRLAPWREQLNQEREENLHNRELLCEQLETLLDQPAEDADPDMLREIRDKARQQWRHYSPVPREKSETVGRRFGKIRHRLQALIDHRAEHIGEQKRGLIAQAQTLQNDREQPLATRIAQTKQLQQQWRQLGRAPKGEEQVLWKTFRHACDQLFAQRDAHKNEQAARQQQHLDDLQALVDQMDSWQPAHANETATLDEYLKKISQLEPLPRHRRSDGIQRRLSGIVRARRERLSRLSVAESVAQWNTTLPLRQAHLAADQHVLMGEAAQSVDVTDVLPAAFSEAHHQRNHLRLTTPVPLTAAQMSMLEDDLARLRVHLSLLALGSVKQRDEPLRLAIQVERLSEGLRVERSRADEIANILASLLALGPMPIKLWEKEVAELDSLLSRLARVPHP